MIESNPWSSHHPQGGSRGCFLGAAWNGIEGQGRRRAHRPLCGFADLAQLVEQRLCKALVVGSIPAIGFVSR